VRQHQAKAVVAAYMVLQDRQAAEDVVQNAFLCVDERIGQYDESRPFEPWFLRSVINAALDTAKHQSRWISLEAQVEAENDAGAPVAWLLNGQPWPEDLVETGELRQAVRSALKQLNAEQRAEIVLRYFLDMNEAEMVRTLSRPPSTIKWRLHEAKRHLKELLQPLFPSRSENPHEE
jgi:RNA polymerase sigma-70 factor (ECF subfamily)